MAPTPDTDGDLTIAELHLAAQFLAESPFLRGRRVHVTSAQIVAILAQKMIDGGMDPDALGAARWLWCGTSGDGGPDLFVVLPGCEG